MTNQYIANYCMDNPEHQMFRVTDGARCVECNGMVNVKEVTKAEHYRLPTYQQLRYELKQKQKPKQSLSISVDMDTNKMQLKLRAIAKHTEALANELDAIDSDDKCTNLSAEQIEMINGMLKRNEKGMAICSCDIQRILEGTD